MNDTYDPIKARKKAEQDALLEALGRRRGAPRDVTKGPEGKGPAAGSFASIRQVMEPAANFLPGVGDALAARDAGQNARAGNWGRAAVDLMSMAPVVGALGDGARAIRSPLGKRLADMDFDELIQLGKKTDPNGLWDAASLAREGQPMWTREELLDTFSQSFGMDEKPFEILSQQRPRW